MKKITRSFLTISLTSALIFQSITIVSNGEEINTRQISQDISSNDLHLNGIQQTSHSDTEKMFY